MGLEQYTSQLDYNKDASVDTGELEKSIKAGNFEKKDFLETMAAYLKESSYQHALEESLKTSLQTLWAQRNAAVVRFVETYNLQRLFIAPPLQLKENYENIGHAKLIDRFKKNYPRQYQEIETKAKRDNADRDGLVQRDYVDYELAMAALDTYFSLLQPEEESIVKEMGFKDLREFNAFAFNYRTAARMIENITNRHYPDIDKKMKIWNEYCKKSTDIAKKTGYDKPGIYGEHEKYYKKYEASVQAIKGFDPGLYADAQKILEDGYVGLDSESALESWMNANNYVRYCSEEIQKCQKAAGPVMIKGFLSFNRQMSVLQATYERKYNISAVQATLEKYTQTCDGFYALNRISIADAGRVGKTLEKMETTGLNKKYQDIANLYKYIADPTNPEGPFRGIVLDRKLKQAEQLKKQQELDASYAWIRKTFGNAVYTAANVGVGLRNGFYDAIVGTGSALGAMIISFFKDDKAMGSTLRLKESWDTFGKIGLASEMSEPLVKDGKLNMRFDNTVNQLAQGISQMIALLAGGEAWAYGAEKLGAGIAKVSAKTSGVLIENASRVGLFSNAMIQQAGTNYLSAKAQGLTDMESVAYSLFSSAGSAGLELLSPNDMVTGKFSGVLLSLVGKEGKARVMAALALYTVKNLAKEAKDEIIQEEIQGFFTNAYNYMVNSGADIHLDVNMSWADLGSTAIITGLTTGVVSGRGAYQQGKIDAGAMSQAGKEKIKKRIASVPEMRVQYTKQIDAMLIQPPAGVDVEALKQLKNELNTGVVPEAGHHPDVSPTNDQESVPAGVDRKKQRNELGESDWMVNLKKTKDRIVAKVNKASKPAEYARLIVDAYQAYFKSINDQFFALSGHDAGYDHIDREFTKNLTEEQADMIHQMHLLSRDQNNHCVVNPDGTRSTYPGVERVTSESELNAFKGRNLSRVINDPFVVRQLLEYKICGGANSPDVPAAPVIDADVKDANAVADAGVGADADAKNKIDVGIPGDADLVKNNSGTDQETITDQSVTDQSVTTDAAADVGEVQLNNLLTEVQVGATEVDALAEEIQQESSPEKQKSALVRYLKLFVKQLQKAKDVALQAKFAVTDLVTAKSISDGLDAMIAFSQAIITGIDLSKKMTESRWNTYKFPDELKNTGGIAKLKINIWGFFFPGVDMMSAHDKGLRSVMKDILEYFCYVLVKVKLTLEDIQVTEEHALPEKERARREKLEEYEKKFRDDMQNKFDEGLETEFGLKAKVESAMKDMEKVVSQTKRTLAKIDEDRSEIKSEIKAIEAAIEEVSPSPSDSEDVKKRVRDMESRLIKCAKKLEKLKKKREKWAAIKMRVVTLVSPSKLTKGEYGLIRGEMIKAEKKKIKKKGVTLDLSLEVRKEKARVWKEAEKELRKTNKKFKRTEAKKNALREAHMRGYGTEKPVMGADGTPTLDEKGNPVMEYPQAVRLTKTRIMMEATEPDGRRCFTNEEIKTLGDAGVFGFLDNPGNKQDMPGDAVEIDTKQNVRNHIEMYNLHLPESGVNISVPVVNTDNTYYPREIRSVDDIVDVIIRYRGKGTAQLPKEATISRPDRLLTYAQIRNTIIPYNLPLRTMEDIVRCMRDYQRVPGFSTVPESTRGVSAGGAENIGTDSPPVVTGDLVKKDVNTEEVNVNGEGVTTNNIPVAKDVREVPSRGERRKNYLPYLAYCTTTEQNMIRSWVEDQTINVGPGGVNIGTNASTMRRYPNGFPILEHMTGTTYYMPWEYMIIHEKRFKEYHSQTLVTRLARNATYGQSLKEFAGTNKPEGDARDDKVFFEDEKNNFLQGQGGVANGKGEKGNADTEAKNAKPENLDIKKIDVELVEMPPDEVDTEYGTKHYEVKVKYEGREVGFEKFELFLRNPPTSAFVINVEKAANEPRGMGALAYIQLGKELQKRGIQLTPSPALTPGGKILRATLYEMGYAQKNDDYDYGYVFVDKDAS